MWPAVPVLAARPLPIDPARVLLLSTRLPWVTLLLKQASQFAKVSPRVSAAVAQLVLRLKVSLHSPLPKEHGAASEASLLCSLYATQWLLT